MINSLINLSRINKKLLMIALDAILLIFVLWLSYSIRLDYWYFPKDDTIRLILAAPVIGIPIFLKLGLYNFVIRHIDLKELWIVVQAVSLYALLWGIAGSFIQSDFVRERGFVVEIFPRTVIIINWILAILTIGTIRVSILFILNKNLKFSIFNYEFKEKINTDDSGKSRVLIYGAGDAGLQLSLALNNSSKLHPIGFIDDNKDVQGTRISGLNVYASNDIEDLINDLKVDEVLIAIPSASRADRFTIIERLERYPVVVRTLPGMTEIAQGKVNL